MGEDYVHPIATDGVSGLGDEDRSALVPEAVAGLRERLRGLPEEKLSMVVDALVEACRVTKRVRVQRECRKCGCGHVVEVLVPDARAAAGAAKVLFEQLEGRPGVAGVEGSGVRVVRWVEGLDGGVGPADG